MEVVFLKQLEIVKPIEKNTFETIANHEQVMFCNDPATGGPGGCSQIVRRNDL